MSAVDVKLMIPLFPSTAFPTLESLEFNLSWYLTSFSELLTVIVAVFPLQTAVGKEIDGIVAEGCIPTSTGIDAVIETPEFVSITLIVFPDKAVFQVTVQLFEVAPEVIVPLPEIVHV